jgi:hypothetical protein
MVLRDTLKLPAAFCCTVIASASSNPWLPSLGDMGELMDTSRPSAETNLCTLGNRRHPARLLDPVLRVPPYQIYVWGARSQLGSQRASLLML